MVGVFAVGELLAQSTEAGELPTPAAERARIRYPIACGVAAAFWGRS
jgi:hypothetical protein